ncbi:MAG: DegV family protein [Candidatus Neoclostridium sp.]
MQIKILTDASAEISKEKQKELDIVSLDMPVNYDDKEIIDVDIKQFWQLQLAGKRMKTSQPSPERMAEEFNKAKQGGYALICVLISSALSGTYETAQSVKEQVGYDGIYIVDSLNVTVGEQLLVLKARRLIDEGLSPEEIVSRLENMKKRIRLYASVDSLKYLALGGRLNVTVARVGNLLNIKPVISIEKGEVKVVAKKIGLNKTVSEICELVGKDEIDFKEPVVPLFACNDENVNKFLKRLCEKVPQRLVAAPTEIGHVIGTHIGPGGFGIVYVAKEN